MDTEFDEVADLLATHYKNGPNEFHWTDDPVLYVLLEDRGNGFHTDNLAPTLFAYLWKRYRHVASAYIDGGLTYLTLDDAGDTASFKAIANELKDTGIMMFSDDDGERVSIDGVLANLPDGEQAL